MYIYINTCTCTCIYKVLTQIHVNFSPAVNHAVIVGVIRQCDVPYSLMQPCLSFSSIGLTIPSSNLGKSLQLQQSPERVLPTPRKISKEYQNMCGNLMCNRLLLVSIYIVVLL